MSDDFELFGDDNGSGNSSSDFGLFDDDGANNTATSAPVGRDTKARVEESRALFSLTDQICTLLRETTSHLAGRVDATVEEAESWVVSNLKLEGTLNSEARSTLKNILKEHWRNLCGASFDTDYIASAQQLGFMLAYLNLGAVWYQGMSTKFLENSSAVLAQSFAKRFPPLVIALQKAVMMDLSVVTGDYFEAAAQAKSRLITDLATGFEHQIKGRVDELSTLSTVLKSHSDEMTGKLKEMDFETVNMAAAAEEASYSVDNISRHTSKVTGAILEIGRNVTRASEVASDAVNHAQSTEDAVAKLSDVASRIGSIGEAIEAIAKQTRMLSMNAAIEAVRAGEAGKGFAVVASEIKMLSEQTSKSTTEIARSVREVMDSTNEAVMAINGIVETVDGIHAVSDEVKAAVDNQAHATATIADNVTEAANGAKAVTNSVDSAIRALKVSGAAAHELKTSADDLAVKAANMREEVEAYLLRLRKMA